MESDCACPKDHHPLCEHYGEAVRAAVTEYWIRHYADRLCTLCGNRG